MNTMTTGNIQAILALAEQKGLVPDRMTRVIASGILADVFDKDADLSNRDAWRAAIELPPLNPPLFRFIDEVAVPAIGPFKVDCIKVGTVNGVEVGYVDPFFTTCFGGLVEEPQGPTSFRRNELNRTGSCTAIDGALGKGVEEATCGQIIWMMANGKIRKDGKATIFRVRDCKGVLRLVCVNWLAYYGDWYVYAYGVDDGDEWRAKRLVFSRNS